MIDNARVGAAIAELRRRSGLTQSELADRLFVTHQSVSKWETGGALPDIATLHALSRQFGVSMDDLLNGSVQPREYSTWQALESIGAYLSPGVRDMLFESAIEQCAPDLRTVKRLKKQHFLSAAQLAALDAAVKKQ